MNIVLSFFSLRKTQRHAFEQFAASIDSLYKNEEEYQKIMRKAFNEELRKRSKTLTEIVKFFAIAAVKQKLSFNVNIEWKKLKALELLTATAEEILQIESTPLSI